MPHTVIRPIPITRVRVDKSVMTYLVGHGVSLDIVTYAWAIEAEGSKILVDTGCPADLQTSLGYPAIQLQTLEEGLNKIGWRPRDIDLVILTHLHLDHIAYARSLDRATFIVQEKEYSAARSPHPAYEGFYPPIIFTEILRGLSIERISGDKEIVKGVSVMLTPGHTPGGQSILVETEKGVIAITGFCCIRENFEPVLRGISKDLIVPGIHVDVVEVYESMEKLREAAGTVIAIHDASYMNKASIP